jgi:hypothetical protein
LPEKPETKYNKPAGSGKTEKISKTIPIVGNVAVAVIFSHKMTKSMYLSLY